MRISAGDNIRDLQEEFMRLYPFLRIQFYRARPGNEAIVRGNYLNQLLPIKTAGLKSEGFISLESNMTIAELENKLLDQFGLRAKILRQSGNNIWLETSLTADWPLNRQNEHGRELSGGYRADQ